MGITVQEVQYCTYHVAHSVKGMKMSSLKFRFTVQYVYYVQYCTVQYSTSLCTLHYESYCTTWHATVQDLMKMSDESLSTLKTSEYLAGHKLHSAATVLF